MNITPELIDRFFKQECTPEENHIVSEYFDQHPDELEKYLSEDEWQKFEDDATLHPAVSQKMLDVIESSIGKNAASKKMPYKALLIAASVIAFIGIALLIGLNRLNNTRGNNTVAAIVTGATVQAMDTISNKTADS